MKDDPSADPTLLTELDRRRRAYRDGTIGWVTLEELELELEAELDRAPHQCKER